MIKERKTKLYLFSIELLIILLGSVLYSIATVLFVFPSALVFGGTSGISVLLEHFLPFSPGMIIVVINLSLTVFAFVILGKSMAVKTLIGSILTTVFIGLFEKLFSLEGPVIEVPYVSALVGASIIAISSGLMFYVDSSSGGTDIIALIIKKFVNVQIGKALIISDVLIVIVGGIFSGWTVFFSSVIGFFVKTLGIDLVISLIKRFQKNEKSTSN